MSIEKKFDDLIIFKNDMMGNNSFLLINNNHCLIIDPSFSGLSILDYINEHKLKLDGIVLTHCHFDHSKTTKKIIEALPCKVFIHKLDKDTYEKYDFADKVNMNVTKFDQDIFYYDFENLTIGDFKVKSFLTPGHTSGSVSIKYKNYLFTGDCIFLKGYGRTDLPNSNDNDEKKSIKFILNKFDKDTLICPGHGPVGLLSVVWENNKELL